ncbi:CHAT domain-containing protein [Thermocatellispora tengchongensis]|uniref:CHAT domain-containing protein n=1 Tax=Thermocatellispora tengchongensis TaxID=1073253 RepID=UPI0036311786
MGRARRAGDPHPARAAALPPLHALDIEGRPLVERHPVGYAPSASVLRETLRRTADGQGAAVFGDPGGDLPFARAEAKRIAGFLAARPVLRGEVTRDALTGALRRTGIVHFAGHARFVADDPMSSGLVAADGVLTSREVAALGSVTARLVALSGCETGVSRDHPGDDTVGLVRGFLYAGAATVLASLWRVPDHSTAHLITAFYRHLPTGTKAEALRAAMLETRERWPSIYHWAPFVLIGNAE